MDISQLKAIGIDETEAELLMKVRKVTKGKQIDNFQEIYRICVASGLFSEEELSKLQGKRGSHKSFLDVVVKLIKKLFKV